MMKLRRYSRNLVRCGLLLNTLLLSLLILGCSSSTKPSYLKEDICAAVQNISLKEYGVELKNSLVGKTLWVYMPKEDIFVPRTKPEKYKERFAVNYNDAYFKDILLILDYLIKHITPEQEKLQTVQLDKDIAEQINRVWNVIRRVLFSMDRSKGGEPEFIAFIVADIKNGVEISQLAYYLDLKKVSYSFISVEEYQHRTIQDFNLRADLIGDKEGSYLPYNDITLKEFVSRQIEYRIRLKFQKPEVGRNADIDKEITKIAALTLKIYGLKDYDGVELNNIDTEKKTLLSAGAIGEKPTE